MQFHVQEAPRVKKQNLTNQADTNQPDEVEYASFPIVGIAALAGGLEACSELFGPLSSDSGMAFVLVQHRDPSHKSMLTEPLSRTTSLPIHEVVDGMAVEPNHIYIIPPNTEPGFCTGRCICCRAVSTSAPPLPIDAFLQSLADDQPRSGAR